MVGAPPRAVGPVETKHFDHPYDFDPTYGYTRADLMAVVPPIPPPDLAHFWGNRYRAAVEIDPAPRLRRSTARCRQGDVLDIWYRSTDSVEIGGWLLVPRDSPPRRGVVVGHGYGGRDGPDDWFPIDGAALLFPCFRGLSRSARAPVSQDPNWHVLHDIDKRDRYILGGCAADLWLAVSALLALFPWIAGRIGYAGISFGGGIGGLAIPWDDRIARGHLALPTFGHHPLRMTLPSTGSVAAVQRFYRDHPDVLDTLAYYDAAGALQAAQQPVHVAAALFDPMVPPPGQFAIYNAVGGVSGGRKQLFTLSAGHFDYVAAQDEDEALREDLRGFFADL